MHNDDAVPARDSATPIAPRRRKEEAVNHLIADISSDSLKRLVATLEAKLINGTAGANDIEAYIRMQWEIAEREFGPEGPLLDPRD